jgi:DUF2934 family protein
MNSIGPDVIIAAIAGEGWTGKHTGGRLRPTRDEIARLAFYHYEINGRKDGNDIEDWLLAERELAHHYA